MAQATQTGTLMEMLNQSNPQLSQVYDFIKSTGMDAKSAFFMLAKQRNRDPNIIIEQVKNIVGNNKR